jgi:hypothetical protein
MSCTTPALWNNPHKLKENEIRLTSVNFCCASTQTCNIPSPQMAYQQLLSGSWPLLAAVLAVVYLAYGITWRLLWSPLAKFPGPRLAALTLWYEFYYDVIKNGRYMWEIEKMHAKYGLFRYLSISYSMR